MIDPFLRAYEFEKRSNLERLRYMLEQAEEAFRASRPETIDWAKSALETICKAILEDRGQEYKSPDGKFLELPKRIKKACTALGAKTEQLVGRYIKGDPALTEKQEILTSIPGIVDLTACALRIEMPEFATLDAGQTASLSGLAPVTRQSGTWRGEELYPRRTEIGSPSLLHARLGDNPIVSGTQSKIRSPHRRGDAAQTGGNRHHAQEDRLGERPAQGRASLDAKTRLINTDTCQRGFESKMRSSCGVSVC